MLVAQGLIGTHPLDADRVAALKKDAFADSASLAALRHVASGPNGNKVVTVNGGSLGLLQLISDKQGTTTEDDTLEARANKTSPVAHDRSCVAGAAFAAFCLFLVDGGRGDLSLMTKLLPPA